MSDTEEVELSKEERLEAARKKFEELKKKNKKKNKKGKKLKQADDSKEGTPGAEDESDLLIPVKEPEEKLGGEEEDEKAEEEEVEAKVEDVKTEDSPVEEELELSKEAELKIEETPKDSVATTINSEIEKAKEPTSLDKDVKPIEPQEQTLEWLATDDDNTAKSWLDEIQEKPLANDEIVKEEPLEDIVTKQKIEILELKEENTDLKMNKFELLEKIESLESTIKRLNLKLNSKQIDRPLYQSDYNSELSLSPDPPLFLSNHQQQQASGFILTPSFQNFGPDYTDSAGDLRDRLLKWKDWQVDMRNWKSIAGGAIVEI